MVSLADAARKALQVGRKRKAKDASDAGCASALALAALPARLSPPPAARARGRPASLSRSRGNSTPMRAGAPSLPTGIALRAGH